MKRLDRASVPAPTCLSKYRHGLNNWDSIAPEDRREIRTHLERLQGRVCAYCEGSLDELGHHIEHFRSRQGSPSLTFNWNNLYWSCYQEDSCGRYKDMSAGAFNPQDLVDPCREHPDRFFRFRETGEIAVRQGLDSNETRRANETLRVFNLQHPERGRLRSMRRRAVEAYLARDPYIVDTIMSCDDEVERNAYIISELEAVAREPFASFIRHLFIDLI